jgi:hypothetical protein
LEFSLAQLSSTWYFPDWQWCQQKDFNMRYDLFSHNDGVNDRTCKVVFCTSSLLDASEYGSKWESDHDMKVELYSAPLWVDITLIGEDVSWWFDLAQHGCASGMYMPAVTYHEARDTFKRYGAEMLDFLADQQIEWHEAFAREYKDQPADMDNLSTFICSLCIELLADHVMTACEQHGLHV